MHHYGKYIYQKNKINSDSMVIKSSKTEDRLSLSETALIAVFRSNEEQYKNDEEKISTLKNTVRGIAEPKAIGTALKIITELKESFNNGQMNITLIENVIPTIIGGKVLLQVGVVSLNEQAVKQALEG